MSPSTLSHQFMLDMALVGCVCAPLVGFALVALTGLVYRSSTGTLEAVESWIAWISRLAAGAQLVASLGVLFFMWDRDFLPAHNFMLPGAPLFVDWPAVAYILMTGFTGWIVVSYSERYMHREPGFVRFFLCLMVFLLGMALIVLGGALDTLFAGWEIVGVASFLLVGFYLDRTKASRNALRTFMTYRLCDIGLLVGAILTHVIYHSGMFEVIEGERVASLQTHGASPSMVLALSVLIFLAASGKSAQFPFSGWLPRAMEGPTPSTAVFYGSLSIHAGVYLLVRTEDIWFQSSVARGLLFSFGLLSAAQARLVCLVQSTVKGRIAWAAISHVGIMFCELALGWHLLAVAHAFMHAFYRCYQLLASPSTAAFHFREQIPFRHWHFRADALGWVPKAIYMLALNEFNVDSIFNRFVSSRFRAWSAKVVDWLRARGAFFAVGVPFVMVIGAIALLLVGPVRGLSGYAVVLTAIAVGIPFLMAHSAFGGASGGTVRPASVSSLASFLFAAVLCTIFLVKLPAYNSWLRSVVPAISMTVACCSLAVLGDLRQGIAVRINLGFMALGLLLLSGYWVCGESQSGNCLLVLAGTAAGLAFVNSSLLFMLRRRDNPSVAGFMGLALAFPRAAQIFLVGMLALVTVPLTSAFKGEDLVLEAAYMIRPGMTVLGGFMAIMVQLQLIRAIAEGYFGQPRHEVRFAGVDLPAWKFGLVAALMTAVFGATLMFA